MKTYLKALYKREKDTKVVKSLQDFITSKSNKLIDSYCKGELLLPSSIALKELKLKLPSFIQFESSVAKIFNKMIKDSRLFYYNLLKILDNTDNNSKFEKKFNNELQPYGQKIVNNLMILKKKVKILKLLNQESSPKNYNINYSITNIFIKIKNKFIKPVGKFIFSKMPSMLSYFIIEYSYIILLPILFLIYFTLNHKLTDDIDNIPTSLFDILFFILLSTIAIITYPIKSFVNKSINGTNSLAYTYRGFFNNISNKKMHDIIFYPMLQ